MLNSGKKIRVLPDKKNKYSNSRVVRKKNSDRNKKPYPPPLCKLNGRSLNTGILIAVTMNDNMKVCNTDIVIAVCFIRLIININF